MIISQSRRFTFVHIHKAGGTSVERALAPHLAWNDLILGGSSLGEKMQAPYSKRFGLNKHSSVTDIERVCGGQYLDDYYVFALVRHPVHRACSIYNFVATMLSRWAQRHDIPLSEISQRMTDNAAKTTPSLKWASSRIFLRTDNFSGFIRDAEIEKAPGFRSQASSLTRNGKAGIAGDIFRLDDYPQWAERLGNRLGLKFSLPHENPSRVRLADPLAISNDDRAVIEEKFCDDYAAFGYDRLPPVPQG